MAHLIFSASLEALVLRGPLSQTTHTGDYNINVLSFGETQFYL